MQHMWQICISRRATDRSQERLISTEYKRDYESSISRIDSLRTEYDMSDIKGIISGIAKRNPEYKSFERYKILLHAPFWHATI